MLRLATGTFMSDFGTLNRTKLTHGTKPPFDHGWNQTAETWSDQRGGLGLDPTRKKLERISAVFRWDESEMIQQEGRTLPCENKETAGRQAGQLENKQFQTC